MPNMPFSAVGAVVACLLASMPGYAQMQPREAVRFPEGQTVVELSFELSRDKIVIPLRVNGSEPLRFVLDTGASNPLLHNNALADTLNLTMMGQARVRGAGEGADRTIPLAGNVTFHLGDIEITNNIMAISTPEIERTLPGIDWDGVLGRQVFENLVVEIDWSAQAVRFYDPQAYVYEGPGTALPLTFGRGIPYTTGTVVLDDDAPVPVTLVIDTGASHALSLDVQTHQALRLPEATIANTIIGWGLNGALQGQIGRIGQLRLGAFSLDAVVTSFPNEPMESPSGLERHGNLGAGVLKRFRVIFHYAKARMMLEPNARFEEPFAFSTAGLLLQPWKPGSPALLVAAVYDGSPAQEAGIEAGDELVAVDGRAVAEIAVGELLDLFEQEPGVVCTLTLQRGQDRRAVTLRLKRLI